MIYNPFSIENKLILITGASSGIGKQTAIECSKLGAKLIITGRDQIRLLQTFNELSGNGHKMLCVDLSSDDGINEIVNNINFIDGIVHCAGITKTIPFQFSNKENIDEIFKVNFNAPILISSLLIKKKKVSKGGSIVFVSSIAGVYCTGISSSLYSASKGAINGIVKGMAIELASKQIRVNSVNPGIVETSIFDSGVISKEQLEIEKNKYPLKRFGNPNDIAYAIIYLLSDAASWVTGTSLLIDGGFTLQ